MKLTNNEFSFLETLLEPKIKNKSFENYMEVNFSNKHKSVSTVLTISFAEIFKQNNL